MYTRKIVDDRFWLLEEAGIKTALIRRIDEDTFDVYGSLSNEEHSCRNVTYDYLEDKYGRDILIPKEFSVIESTDRHGSLDDINGIPCKHKAFNKQTIQIKGKDIPVYTKTEKSKTTYVAGHYGLKFDTVWRCVYCVKSATLETYDFVGPFKTLDEAEAEMTKAAREYETN